MEQTHHRQGFTLVEVMIVVAIIGLLAGIAVPTFSRARQDSVAQACRNNLRLMEAAKQMASMENSWSESDGPDTLGNPYYRNTCSTFLRSGTRPICPTGPDCHYNGLSESPTCQSGIASHSIH